MRQLKVVLKQMVMVSFFSITCNSKEYYHSLGQSMSQSMIFLDPVQTMDISVTFGGDPRKLTCNKDYALPVPSTEEFYEQADYLMNTLKDLYLRLTPAEIDNLTNKIYTCKAVGGSG